MFTTADVPFLLNCSENIYLIHYKSHVVVRQYNTDRQNNESTTGSQLMAIKTKKRENFLCVSSISALCSTKQDQDSLWESEV